MSARCRSRPDRDELQAAGLTAMPGAMVASPWIKEAPASFECRRHVTLELGKSRQIILGEIVFAHYHPDIIDVERMRIDPAKTRRHRTPRRQHLLHHPRPL